MKEPATRGPSMYAATFSIVGYDPRTGDTGAAVSTLRPAVGNRATQVRYDAGAIAAQALLNVALAPAGLEILAEGASAAEVLEQLRSRDPRFETRQVLIVDRRGHSAGYTGKETIPWAGHRVGPGYAAGGNMLVSEATVNEMGAFFESTADLPLAERLVGALERGHAAGGDKRGHSSAAVYVATADSRNRVDLRVDFDPDPVRRLKAVYEAYRTDILEPLAAGTLGWEIDLHPKGR